ncbi:MAG: hypothetical protein AAGE52_05085 [Myxococcota bacterium]
MGIVFSHEDLALVLSEGEVALLRRSGLELTTLVPEERRLSHEWVHEICVELEDWADSVGMEVEGDSFVVHLHRHREGAWTPPMELRLESGGIPLVQSILPTGKESALVALRSTPGLKGRRDELSLVHVGEPSWRETFETCRAQGATLVSTAEGPVLFWGGREVPLSASRVGQGRVESRVDRCDPAIPIAAASDGRGVFVIGQATDLGSVWVRYWSPSTGWESPHRLGDCVRGFIGVSVADILVANETVIAVWQAEDALHCASLRHGRWIPDPPFELGGRPRLRFDGGVRLTSWAFEKSVLRTYAQGAKGWVQHELTFSGEFASCLPGDPMWVCLETESEIFPSERWWKHAGRSFVNVWAGQPEQLCRAAGQRWPKQPVGWGSSIAVPKLASGLEGPWLAYQAAPRWTHEDRLVPPRKRAAWVLNFESPSFESPACDHPSRYDDITSSIALSEEQTLVLLRLRQAVLEFFGKLHRRSTQGDVALSVDERG